MKLFNSQSIILLFSSLVFLTGSVQAIDLNPFDDENEEVIWEVSTNVYLKYAEQDDSEFGKNDHPVELNEEEIRKALKLLVIQGEVYTEQEEEPNPVFTPLQVNILSKHLAKGLAKAQPDQDIIFALKKNKDRFLGLKKATFFLAGRVFYKDGKLNIILGDYDFAKQEGYEAVYDPTHVGIVAYHFNYGKRSKASQKFEFPIKEVDGIELKDGKRRDWFVIDLKTAAKTYDVQVSQREKDELEGKRKELREILGEDAISGRSAKEQAQINKERREMRAEMARMRKEMKEMSGGKTSGSQSVEERLSTLDRLKKKGLVSDKEYQRKRQEILNDI